MSEFTTSAIKELLPPNSPDAVSVGPGMYVTRAFEAAQAAQLVAAAAGSPRWHPAGINLELTVDKTVRDAEVLYEEENPALFAICRDQLYIATFGLAAKMAGHTVLAEMQLVRYPAGGKYADHRDTPTLDASPRRVSLVCYLNDDLSGGATAFTDPEITIHPTAGVALLFSPLLIHRAEPVTAGTKYAIVAWYLAPPPR